MEKKIPDLTWKKILNSQQKDFIERLKYHDRLPDNYKDWILFSTLSAIDEAGICEKGYNNEVIELNFHEQHENEIDDFCTQLVYKYSDPDSDNYLKYLHINNKIGKIGEEAVKIYLGSLVSAVDYNIYPDGDEGIDFYVKKNNSIKIQVKTKSLRRITCKKYYEDNDIDYLDLCALHAPDPLGNIEDMQWEISYKESNLNQILICVVLLNPIAMDEFFEKSKSYMCLMAGFIPIEKKSCSQSFKMNDLLYMGGIKAYLESL